MTVQQVQAGNTEYVSNSGAWLLSPRPLDLSTHETKMLARTLEGTISPQMQGRQHGSRAHAWHCHIGNKASMNLTSIDDQGDKPRALGVGGGSNTGKCGLSVSDQYIFLRMK